jgi:hypothetical protein
MRTEIPMHDAHRGNNRWPAPGITITSASASIDGICCAIRHEQVRTTYYLVRPPVQSAANPESRLNPANSQHPLGTQPPAPLASPAPPWMIPSRWFSREGPFVAPPWVVPSRWFSREGPFVGANYALETLLTS